MSPQDAIAYGRDRQRELLPSKGIDDLVNAVTVTDGSAQRNLAARRIAVIARIAANALAASASAGRRLGESVSLLRPKVR